MSDIPPIQGAGTPVGSVGAVQVRPSTRADAAAEASGVDEVQISEIGQLLSQLDMRAPTRADRIAYIKQAIQDGTYLTDRKIDITAELLVDALRSDSVSV